MIIYAYAVTACCLYLAVRNPQLLLTEPRASS